MRCSEYLQELSIQDRTLLDSFVAQHRIAWAPISTEQYANIPKPFFAMRQVQKALNTTSYLSNKGHRISLCEYKPEMREFINYVQTNDQPSNLTVKGGRMIVCDAQKVLWALKKHAKKAKPAPVPPPDAPAIRAVPNSHHPCATKDGQMYYVCEPHEATLQVRGQEQIRLAWEMLLDMQPSMRERWKKRLLSGVLYLCPEKPSQPSVTHMPEPVSPITSKPPVLERDLRQELVNLSAYGLRSLIQEWPVADGSSFRRYDLVDLSLQSQGYIEVIELKRGVITKADIEQKVYKAGYLRLARQCWPEARIRLVFVSPMGMAPDACTYLLSGGPEMQNVMYRSLLDQKLRLMQRIRAERLPNDTAFLVSEIQHLFEPATPAGH